MDCFMQMLGLKFKIEAIKFKEKVSARMMQEAISFKGW
jgi:hypothetical protein